MEIDFSELKNTDMDSIVYSMIRCKNCKIFMLLENQVEVKYGMEKYFSQLKNAEMDITVYSMIRCKNYKFFMLFKVLPEALFGISCNGKDGLILKSSFVYMIMIIQYKILNSIFSYCRT